MLYYSETIIEHNTNMTKNKTTARNTEKEDEKLTLNAMGTTFNKKTSTKTVHKEDSWTNIFCPKCIDNRIFLKFR